MAELFKSRIFWCSMIGAMIGSGLHQYVRNHSSDESGTITNKSNYEIMVDIDADNRPDRVIKFYDIYADNIAYYNYAQVGDKISYCNTWNRDTLSGVSSSYNKIRKINGKSAKEIQEWYEMLKHSQIRTR